MTGRNMRTRIAALITSYNMPERAGALVQAIARSSWPVDVFLIDNGSDIVPPSEYTTLRLEKNIQTTGGWLAGWNYARTLYPYFAYMFIITSAEFVSGDPVAACAELLLSDDNAAGVHPALTQDSTTMWNHMKARGADHKTWMVDNICSTWRADFFEAHPFDPALIYGHGIDLELCYFARKEKRNIWIAEGAQVKKVTDIGYQMNRMRMTADERRQKGFANMTEVLSKRYGPDYWNFLTKSYVTDEML